MGHIVRLCRAPLGHALAVIIISGCKASVDPDPIVVTYGVAPSSLDMAIGQTLPMTIAALSSRGDTLPSGEWIRPLVSGSAQLSLFSCDYQVGSGHGCTVTAISAGTGTIAFELGNYYGCIDPPECTGRHWGSDTVLVVPVIVR